IDSLSARSGMLARIRELPPAQPPDLLRLDGSFEEQAPPSAPLLRMDDDPLSNAEEVEQEAGESAIFAVASDLLPEEQIGIDIDQPDLNDGSATSNLDLQTHSH